MDRVRVVSGSFQRVKDGWQRFIVHLDKVHGIPHYIAVLAYHHRHGLSDIADLVAGQYGLLGAVHFLDLPLPFHGSGGEIA
jgi:hypothetical protein